MNRSIVFILFFIFSVSIEAQFNRQRMQPRTPAVSQQQRFPEVNVEKAVGMIFYDSEKVLKKIGVKKSSKNFDLITSILKKFNREQNQVKRINSFLFSEGKSKIEFARKESVKLGDFSIIRNATKEVTTLFEPIVEVIKEKEKKLDLEFEKILSSKEFSKWNKYKTNLKKK